MFRRVVTSKAMVPTGEFEGYANSLRTPEGPLPGQATTGLTSEQFDELVERVEQRVTWNSGQGRPRELMLRQAVKAVVMYFRTNITQEVIAELLFVDQSTISRAISDLEEIIAEALDEFIPELPEEIKGRVGVVDGSLCPCWSWGRCCIVRSRVGETLDPGWSDCQGQRVEGGQDASVDDFLGAQFVVAAADVLDERVPSTDHLRAAELFKAAHRSQAELQPSVIGFDRIVRILLGHMAGGGCQLIEHAGVGGRAIGGDFSRGRPVLEGAGKESAGGSPIPLLGDQNVDDLPELIDRPV